MDNYTALPTKALLTLMAKVLEDIEKQGLPERQEFALKRSIKDKFYFVMDEIAVEVPKVDLQKIMKV